MSAVSLEVVFGLGVLRRLRRLRLNVLESSQLAWLEKIEYQIKKLKAQ